MATEIDDREQVITLLANLKAALPALEQLLRDWSSHWGYEDPIYRLYHQSFKVYRLQDTTQQSGTGKHFVNEHNRDWLRHTRPIADAFFHARFFLEMAVKYGRELDAPPTMLPSGWAALLYLFNLR